MLAPLAAGSWFASTVVLSPTVDRISVAILRGTCFPSSARSVNVTIFLVNMVLESILARLCDRLGGSISSNGDAALDLSSAC